VTAPSPHEIPGIDRRVDRWLAELESRHRSPFRPPELLKALRALSSHYVERRATLPSASPLDSRAKRAAFAVFYAPLHFLTVRAIVRSIGAARAEIHRVVDLGCGTGVASAAWALECADGPQLHGVDALGWAVDETAWNWRALGLSGRARRGDLVATAARLAGPAAGSLSRLRVIAGWSVNELTGTERARLLPLCLTLHARGARVLIVEPIARRVTPWWDEWALAFGSAGGRSDDWSFDIDLPPALTTLGRDAGFRRDRLTSRSLWL
jgi:hypothetical protein